MRPPSLHSKFFSSLNQVKKRLDSEDKPSLKLPSTHQLSTASPSTDSPLFLFCNESNHSPTLQDTNDATAQDFLSCSPAFHQTPNDPLPAIAKQLKDDGKDEIEQLIELLGLLETKEKVMHGTGGDDGFNSKIVGMKGPKCDKEMKRLNGWIQYFMSDGGDGQRKEPLRLVHLLLGKAAAVAASGSGSGSEDDFEFEFPSTVEEFLEHDPPT